MNFCVFFNFNHPFRSNVASVNTFFNMVASNFIGVHNNTHIWTGLTLRIPLIYKSAWIHIELFNTARSMYFSRRDFTRT